VNFSDGPKPPRREKLAERRDVASTSLVRVVKSLLSPAQEKTDALYGLFLSNLSAKAEQKGAVQS
jgi:hypothetical protein